MHIWSRRNEAYSIVHSFSGKLVFRNFKKIFPYKKQRVLRFTYNSMFFFKKSVVFIENALCLKCYSIPTPTFAGYISVTRYEWENQKSDNSQFPIILMVVKTFSARCFFGEGFEEPARNFFGTKSNLKGSPLTSKATNGYFGQGVWNWIKGNDPRFEKIRPDANNKNFMWITRGRR